MTSLSRETKMRFCWYCGNEIGVYAEYDRFDTCGKLECERATRETFAAEREEAHRQLDRDNGWSE